MSENYVNGVSDEIAALRSARGAHNVNGANKSFAVAEAQSVARAVELHGSDAVAEVARRLPAAFENHHGDSAVGKRD